MSLNHNRLKTGIETELSRRSNKRLREFAEFMRANSPEAQLMRIASLKALDDVFGEPPIHFSADDTIAYVGETLVMLDPDDDWFCH